MLAYRTEKCSICEKEFYGIIQEFECCTRCGKFVCSECQHEGCECGNNKFENAWESLEREHPGDHFIF